MEVFAPKEQVPPAGGPEQMVEQPSPAPTATPAGGAPLPPGMGGMGAPQPGGGAPDIMTLLSGLTGGGEATASVRTSRRR